MRTSFETRKRLVLVLFVMVFLFTCVTGRIAFLTLRRGKELTLRGVKQWTREGIVTAQRGKILDARGEVLAISATSYIVSANPRMVDEKEMFARVMSEMLDTDEENILKKIKKQNHASVILKRQVPRKTVDEIRRIRRESDAARQLLKGVAFDEDVRRWYPKGAFLSQVLGLVNVDSKGQSGLEAVYEEELSGVPGLMKTEVDAKARLLPDGKMAYIPPEAGNDVVLTIDSQIQGVAEKAMRECLSVNQARAVSCIVMNPETGEILAMCMKPDYDPNDPPRNDGELLRRLMRMSTVTDVYEPGSTFKILTCAAALDSGAAEVNSRFHCSGEITVDGDKIRCWKNSHGAQTLKEGLANSCNPVFVSLALRMGTDTFYRYLHSFGLGQKTNLGLPGESTGILIKRERVKNVDLARIGFGQSVAVTPVQMLCAASACVNGGHLMQPFIVKEIRDQEGNVLKKNMPRVVSNPVSEETSDMMRELLQNVVDHGGGRNGGVPGYAIGGKTGTAQVYKNGKVSSDTHIGSFVGFAPMDAPQVAVLVTVHEAQVPVDYGSATAAPFARQILEEILPYLHIEKESTGKENSCAAVPDVVGKTLEEAKKELSEKGLFFEHDGQSDTVTAQSPRGGTKIPKGTKVMLYTYEQNPFSPMELVSVPDVTGLSIVEAERLLRMRGLGMNLQGSGLAVSQRPAGGTFLEPGKEVLVKFSLPAQMEE